MKSSQEKSDSLQKALRKNRPFDEADYYKSKKAVMGGEDVNKDDEEKEEDDLEDDIEDHEFYGDDD